MRLRFSSSLRRASSAFLRSASARTCSALGDPGLLLAALSFRLGLAPLGLGARLLRLGGPGLLLAALSFRLGLAPLGLGARLLHLGGPGLLLDPACLLRFLVALLLKQGELPSSRLRVFA